MSPSHDNFRRFPAYVWLTLGTFVVVVATFVVYVRAEKQIDRAHERRHQSIMLADELRQSSDDLTRMVRTYVVTDNPLYKQRYQEILDIRDGKRPRPVDYQSIYWDLVMPDDVRPSPPGAAIPLLTLMRQAGFTDEEFAKLSEAKANSDALTRTEFAAMQLIESTRPPGASDRDKAIVMLHDAAYHQAKAGIMAPIARFYEMADQRTLEAVRAAETRAVQVRLAFVLLGVLLVLLILSVRRRQQEILGGSLEDVHAVIAKLSGGDFTAPLASAKGREDSVLGWLAETQLKLASLDAERSQSESELKKYQNHLETLVEERTAALSLAKEVAVAANRAKSTFLANMSHELRTPMNAIMGMTSMALRHVADPKLRDQLGKIDLASQHLLSVINDILDISKIEAERLTLEQVGFRLGEVLENLISLIGHRAADKGLALQVDMAPEIARLALQGDPLRLGQILLNLAGNAIKFTERGAITVRVRLADETPSAVRLRFEVQDTGIGIAPADQQRLFSAFEQADSSMTRKYGGSGLGLAISKRLAHLMGGEIGVTSEVGVGSTFWFAVRLSKAAAAVAPAPTFVQAPAEVQLRARHAGTRILLAEDEPINQEVSRGLLEDVGLVVDLAEDGVQAVDMARRAHYDLILMDMQMPNLNGIEATCAIRALPGHERTPILAMTANAFNEDRQTCLAAGMNDHIAKPVDPHVLFETILKWLATSRR